MNENVTNKTPKRRRWIARLLVSALCILLASSLLFVGVVADTITLTIQFRGNYPLSVSSVDFLGFVDASSFYYFGDDYLFFQKGSSISNTATFAFSSLKSSCYNSGTIYVAEPQKVGSTRRISVTSIDIDTFESSIFNFNFGTTYNTVTYYGTSCFYSDKLYVFVFYSELGSGTVCRPIICDISSGSRVIGKTFALPSDFVFSQDAMYSTFVVNGYLVNLTYNIRYDISSNSYVSDTDFGLPSSFSGFFYNGDLYVLTPSSILLFDNTSFLFSAVGSFSGNPFLSYCSENVVTVFNSPTAYSLDYAIYTGIDGQPPSESSDETTESPPPESSDESSEDPAGGTKIWGSILNADGSYTSTLLGTLDLSQATEVRAYIGSWTSKDSSYQSETPVPLTFYVYNGEEGPPDIYTFDYHAAGYSLSGDSVSDFTFPDIIGQFFTLPFNGETDLYFANVAPYGTVLVSTPFGDSFGGRVMLNLVSADSYFRLDFVDEDTFTVVVYNEDPVGSRVSFEMDIRAYREGYRLEDGETSSSRWFYPSFGSSASYTAEYVTENGLYLVFVDSVNDTVYPWEDGTWSDIIGDANSRLEDISVDHALLESMANDAYGQYSFDPMTNQNFVGAVSQFNDIRDSSGGEYILRYMWGMWNVHPFASSMIAIVGTLAIVGFIIRKM